MHKYIKWVLKRLLSKYMTGWICTSLFFFWLCHGKRQLWSKEVFASVMAFIHEDGAWFGTGHGTHHTKLQLKQPCESWGLLTLAARVLRSKSDSIIKAGKDH